MRQSSWGKQQIGVGIEFLHSLDTTTSAELPQHCSSTQPAHGKEADVSCFSRA